MEATEASVKGGGDVGKKGDKSSSGSVEFTANRKKKTKGRLTITTISEELLR